MLQVLRERGNGAPLYYVSLRYREFARRTGHQVTIVEQVAPGLELCFGLINDAQYEPVVIVARVRFSSKFR